jgi:hypothetical protein
MARAAFLVCAMLLVACPDNPYVIGRVREGDAQRPSAQTDAGLDAADADECAAAHQNALLCSGFESAELEAEWDDSASAREGTLERTGSRVHSGMGALHASSAGPSSYALVSGAFGPLYAGDLYVRTYVYVPAALRTEIMNVLFVGDGDPVEGFHGVDFNLENGAAQLFSPQAPQRYTDSALIPRDRWFCLRMHVGIDDQRGSVQVFVEERLALQSALFDTLPDDGINQLRLGIDWASEQEELFEIYFDDVVVDTAPVRCLP